MSGRSGYFWGAFTMFVVWVLFVLLAPRVPRSDFDTMAKAYAGLEEAYDRLWLTHQDLKEDCQRGPQGPTGDASPDGGDRETTNERNAP